MLWRAGPPYHLRAQHGIHRAGVAWPNLIARLSNADVRLVVARGDVAMRRAASPPAQSLLQGVPNTVQFWGKLET